jgi:3',5'-cyclic AMP phosphodiesterase CpdA
MRQACLSGRLWTCASALMVASLVCVTASSASPPGQAVAQHVLVIGCDGLGSVAFAPTNAPVLHQLMRAGAYTLHARAVMPTSSSPNWASMIMGAAPEQHGVTSNDWETNKFDIAPTAVGPAGIFPTIFGVLREQKPGAQIACIYDWDGFGRLLEPQAPNLRENVKGTPATARRAIEIIKERKPDFLFIQFDAVDHAGHESGWKSPQYFQTVEEIDALIGNLLAALTEAGIRDQTIVVVTADHGGKGKSHGGMTMDELEIPLILNGPGIKKGHELAGAVNTYDLAPTLARIFQIEPPACWIGQPVVDAFIPETTDSTVAGSITKPTTGKVKKVPETVQPIAAPRHPLPPEEGSADITRFSFIVYGDTRGRRDGKAIQYEHSLVVDAMLDTIKKLEKTTFPVRFVLQSGDAVADGRNPQQWNVSFVELINRLTTEGGVPYFLAPGNHDVTGTESILATNRLKGLQNYLAAMAELIPNECSPRRLEGYPTYAFAYGNSFVIALDSNIANNDVQYTWVEEQLAGLDRERYHHILVFCHHPPFSSGPHGGATVESQVVTLRKQYMPLFRAYHVEAIFAGHEHLFEHWVERYEDGDKRYRIDEIVTGGGGAPLYAYKGEPDLRDYLKVNAAQKVTVEHLAKPGLHPGETPFHYVVVRVDGDLMSVDVVGVDWGRGFQPYRSSGVTLADPTK